MSTRSQSSRQADFRSMPRIVRGTPQQVAQRLLGQLLVRRLGSQRLSGVIVEVEAYLSQADPASHSARGLTPRNRSMFSDPGRLYVYSIHTHHCVNVVTELAGLGSAILIRSLEPLEGMATMSRLRGVRPATAGRSHAAWLRMLTSGPGRLCQALAIDRRLDGLNLAGSDQLWIEPPPATVRRWKAWSIGVSGRIGISRGRELPLRWFVEGHQLVSGPACHHRAGRHWRFGT